MVVSEKKVEETYGVRVRCHDLRERKRAGVVWAISDAKDKDACIVAIQHIARFIEQTLQLPRGGHCKVCSINLAHIQRAAGVAGTPWKDTLETVWH